MVDNILKNVRKTYVIASIRPLILVIITLPISLVALCLCAHEGFHIGLLLPSLFCGAVAIFTICQLCKIVPIIIDPRKCSVFSKYGNEEQISRILWEISNTKEYESKHLVISRNYIYNPKEIVSLVACDDVLGVHKYIHKTNWIVDEIALDVTDKYGAIHRFDVESEEKCNELLKYLMYKCRNAKFGYSNEQQEYIKQNVIPVQDVREIQMQRETFFCTNCGHRMRCTNKFCERCGTKAFKFQ